MAYIEYQPRIINDKRRLILLFALLCVLRINAAPYLWSESFMTGTLQDDGVCMGGDYQGSAIDSGVVSAEAGAGHETPVLPGGNELNDRFFLTTNMLYDAALTPNIGVGLCVTDRITVLADWMYARWSNRDKRRYWRIYGGDIEARYRIGWQKASSPLAGHHVGVYYSMACYDFQAGRSHRGVLSDKWNYAVGMSYTYSMPITTRLNIDFSLGVGYLWGMYKRHTPIDDCDVWLSTHKLGWFGPTKAGVSLVWLIGSGAANKRKGGGR